MNKKNKGIRFLLSFRLGYFFRSEINISLIINQFAIENISDTLQFIVASIKGSRVNEPLENKKSVTKLSKRIPPMANQTSLKARYFIRLSLLKRFIRHGLNPYQRHTLFCLIKSKSDP